MNDAPKPVATAVKEPVIHQDHKKPDATGPMPLTAPAAQPVAEKK